MIGNAVNVDFARILAHSIQEALKCEITHNLSKVS